MAIGMIQVFQGTPEQYWEGAERLGGFTPGGPGPAHCLFHWVAQVGDKMHLFEVWDSREAMGEWAARTGPVVQELGIAAVQEPQFFEVFNFLTAGPDTQGVSDYLNEQAQQRQPTS